MLEAGKRGSPGRAVQAGIRGKRLNEFVRCRGNTWTMCEFRDSNGNGLGDIWWTDKSSYFSV